MSKNPRASAVSWLKKYNSSFLLTAIFVLGVFFFGVLLTFVQRLNGTDDTIFPIQTQPYSSVFEWVKYRYENWSGRLFAETFVYIFSHVSIIFWKIVTLAIYILISASLFLYYKLFTASVSRAKDCFMLFVATIFPFLLDPGILFHSTFWMTGSMNYFWIMAFGLVGFYPLAYFAVRKERPNWAILLIGLLSACVAAGSQEQIGAVMGVASTIFAAYSLYSYWKLDKKIALYSLIFCIAIMTSFLIQALAPGNDVRIEAETIRWLPDFYTTPLPEHITYSLRWLVDALINHMGLLLVSIWGVLIALFMRKNQKDIWDKAFLFILFATSALILMKGFGTIHVLYEFYPTWKPHLPNTLSSLIMIPWGIALIVTSAAPLALYRHKLKGCIVTLLLFAAIAATAIVTLSPTMYISGLRTLFVPSILLAFTLFILLDEVFDNYKKARLILVSGLLSVAVAHYFLVLFAFLK